MSTAEPWTIGRLLAWTAQYLQQHGADNPQLEAQLLLAHARECQRIDLFTAYSEIASEAVRDRFRELVRRRAQGTPVAYLTGRREFYSLEFRVTPDVLIPRPESEFVILTLLDLMKTCDSPSGTWTMADVGTGSGILATCAARHVPQGRVWATDICAAALEVARENCQRHGVADRVELLVGDLLAPVPPQVRLDVILSNPPYVSEPEYANLPRDVRDFEPREALVAGPTGVEVIARLVPEAAARLRPGGWLIMEISPMIAEAVRTIVTENRHFDPPSIIPDLAGHPRVVQAALRS